MWVAIGVTMRKSASFWCQHKYVPLLNCGRQLMPIIPCVQVSGQLAGKCAELMQSQSDLRQAHHMLAAAYAANAALQLRFQHVSVATPPMHNYLLSLAGSCGRFTCQFATPGHNRLEAAAFCGGSCSVCLKPVCSLSSCSHTRNVC